MSKYTTELRYICENYAGLAHSEGYDSVDSIIAAALPKIFNFTWPIFDEAYRTPLETKIIRHFYTREIGAETVGLWKLRLQSKLNEIMPYYNLLYKAYTMDFNPLYDTDLTTTYQKTGSEDTDGTVTSTLNKSGDDSTNSETTVIENRTTDDTAKTVQSGETADNATSTLTADKTERDLYSDTPQGALTGVEEQEYLTNARKKTGNENETRTDTAKATNSSTTDGTNTQTVQGDTTDTGNTTRTWSEKDTDNTTQNKTINTTEDYTLHVAGKSSGVTYGQAFHDFVSGFINVDEMLLNALEPLFMGVW